MSEEAGRSLIPPIGAGDLIDRAIRLYRQHFLTFVLIILPPILLVTSISVSWSLFAYSLWNEDSLLAFFLLLFGKNFFWLLELILIFCLMGGLSKNLVTSIIFDTPLSFRETYLNTISRIGSLFLSSLMVLLLLGGIFFIIFFLGLLTWSYFIVGVLELSRNFTAFGTVANYLLLMFSILVSIAIFLGFGWVFFFIASRFIYVPQMIVVENQDSLSAVLRSFKLAHGNTNRVYALFMFTLIAVYIALALLYMPIALYAYLNGIETFNLISPETAPAWYTIANELIFQVSLILMNPILISGLCLLYVDEKIRNEGYDVELLAARYLKEIQVDLPKERVFAQLGKEQEQYTTALKVS